MISTENGPIKGQQLKAIIIRMPNRQMIVIIFSILLIMKLYTQSGANFYTRGLLFIPDLAVEEVSHDLEFLKSNSGQ